MVRPSGSSDMEGTLQNLGLFFNYGLPLAVLMAAYFIGSIYREETLYEYSDARGRDARISRRIVRHDAG